MHDMPRTRDARSDAGMSVVEVLIASVILLIALTSMLALLLTTTGLSARARAMSMATTSANKFIESVRDTDYSTLNQSKLNQLATAASGTVGGMTVSITASMTAHYEESQDSSGSPAYQELRVSVRVTGPGFKTFTLTTGTYVRPWNGSASGETSGAGPSANPTVWFDSETPEAGSPNRPIWGSTHIGAGGRSNMTGVNLILVRVSRTDTLSEIASSAPNAIDGTCGTLWDTTAVPEGSVIVLRAEAFDQLDGYASNTRTVIIDNVRPPAPSAPSLVYTTGNSSTAWSWNAVMDGASAAPGYATTWSQQTSSGGWTDVAGTVTEPAASLATDAFSKYHLSVMARGPRAVFSGQSDWVSAATEGPDIVTRPSFTAMAVGIRQANGANKPFYFTATSLVLSPPTFQASAPSYHWEYKIGSGAWTAFTSAASPNTNPSTSNSVKYGEVAGPSEAVASLSFRCTATVGTETFKSPIMTVVNPSGGSTYSLSNFTSGTSPDWTTAW